MSVARHDGTETRLRRRVALWWRQRFSPLWWDGYGFGYRDGYRAAVEDAKQVAHELPDAAGWGDE